MATLFTSCSKPKIELAGETIENQPVNLYWCKYLSKGIRNNGGGNCLYTIGFNGISITWAFKTEGERDSEYESLMRVSR